MKRHTVGFIFVIAGMILLLGTFAFYWQSWLPSGLLYCLAGIWFGIGVATILPYSQKVKKTAGDKKVKRVDIYDFLFLFGWGYIFIFLAIALIESPETKWYLIGMGQMMMMVGLVGAVLIKKVRTQNGYRSLLGHERK